MDERFADYGRQSEALHAAALGCIDDLETIIDGHVSVNSRLELVAAKHAISITEIRGLMFDIRRVDGPLAVPGATNPMTRHFDLRRAGFSELQHASQCRGD
jgi:hypothetical protein